MALETNLNTTPYWDDYNELKNFHRILFKPGVSVQTRELNQIQSILQNQIERFGDHVFKSGTIVSGINFDYNPLFPYIKILDVTEDGQPVSPSSYVGLYVKNSSNLQALVCKHESGFETKDPDLNTLYLKYINSGSNQNTTSFSNSELLEVFNRNNQLFKVSINNGGLGFSNSDTLHVVSAITVNVASGTFTNNEIITQSTTGARVQIVGIYNDPEFTSRKILSIKPINSEQLSNTSANSTTWTIQDGYNVTGNTSSAVANVLFSVGGGASGVISTDSLGVVQTITLSSGGAGYITNPQVVIKPSSASASVSTLDLLASKNYAKLRVASGSYTNPVGYGYSFSITEGIIYQKGIFSRVSPQTVIVSKYSSTPANVMIGFKSDESIVKYTTDSSLYDNAANTLNESAPGADRLKINPTLYVVNSNIGAANSEFLPLVEFVDGLPARENRDSVYNQLSKEFERRTFETSGNFVINSFDVTSKEIVSNTTHVKINVNPGVAYISGKRVQTISGTSVNIEKSNTYNTSNNLTITANYGNYLKVKELAGEFQFHTGAEVDLYDTAHQRLTNITVGSSTTITPSGSKIGTARIRSLVYESGTVGTPDAVFRLYVFDVSMNAGKNFRDVKSVYFNGTYDGICDVVRETESTTNNQVSYIYDTENPDVIFRSRLFGVKSIYDLSYTYRTSNNSLTLYSNGSIEISHPTNVFPYGGSTTLSSSQKKDFTIIPTANVDVANAVGSVSCNTTSPNVIGTSTTFTSEYKPGDYIKVKETGGGSATDVRRVEQVVNNTLLILNSNCSFLDSNANTALFFPAYYPINLDRTDRTIITDPTPTTARVNIGNSSLASSVTVIAHYNLKIASATQINKDLNRNLYVKIYTGNNNTVSASGNNFTGPWSLGVPDVFRLKNVYFGNTVSDTDVTKYFYVNSQDDGDKVKNAHLILKRNAGLEISNTQWLLVKFDAFDVNSAEGYVTRDSYSSILNDSSGFSNSTYINTLEIPEVLTAEGRYYDGIDSLDFRPFVDNTAILTSTVGSATVNPANSQSINSDEKFFPLPDSEIIFDADYYIPRIDRIYITSKNEVKSVTGTPNIIGNLITPINPTDSMSLSRIFVPPYPSLPFNYSNTTFQILDKKVGNDTSIVNNRENLYKIKNITSTTDNRAAPVGYSMARINKLEKRLDSLEKEILLTKLENSILEKVIPSSTNPAKNRFKNGFLVDSFDNHNIVDLKNVENSCFIDTDTGELLPTRFSYNLENIFDRSDANTVSSITGNQFASLPYEEITIIRQLNASLPKNVLPPANTIYVANVTNVTVGSNTTVNTNPITNTNIIIANVEPIIQGPSLIKEEDEFLVQITKARPNELVTFVGSYNWTSGSFLSSTGSFNADAGGYIKYYEPKWLNGTGTFTWEFTFNTSGWTKKLTTTVSAKGQQNVVSANTSANNDPYSRGGTTGGLGGDVVVLGGVTIIGNDGLGSGSTVLELSSDWTEEGLGLGGTGNDSITGDDVIVITGDEGYTYDTYDNTDLLNNEGNNNEGTLVVEDGADSSVTTVIGDDSEFLNSLDGGEAAAAIDSLGSDQIQDNESASDSGTRYGDQYDVDIVGNDGAVITNETIGDDVISSSDGYGDSYTEFEGFAGGLIGGGDESFGGGYDMFEMAIN